MAGLPPLPPGFTLDTPQQPSGVMTVGTPRPQKPEFIPGAPGQVYDPKTGGARDLPGFKPPASEGKTTYRRMTNAEKAAAGIDPALPAYMGSDGLPKVPDGAKPAATSKQDLQDVAFTLRNVIDKALQARDLSHGWFATGFGSGLAQKIGGTSAADVHGLLATVGSNTAFDRLQKMRDASPTGGALGAISERELELLQSTIASLNQSQSDEQFRNSMMDVARAYGRVLSKLPGGRAMMIERGWLPKSSSKAPAQQSGDGWGKAEVVK